MESRENRNRVDLSSGIYPIVLVLLTLILLFGVALSLIYPEVKLYVPREEIIKEIESLEKQLKIDNPSENNRAELYKKIFVSIPDELLQNFVDDPDFDDISDKRISEKLKEVEKFQTYFDSIVAIQKSKEEKEECNFGYIDYLKLKEEEHSSKFDHSNKISLVIDRLYYEAYVLERSNEEEKAIDRVVSLLILGNDLIRKNGYVFASFGQKSHAQAVKIINSLLDRGRLTKPSFERLLSALSFCNADYPDLLECLSAHELSELYTLSGSKWLYHAQSAIVIQYRLIKRNINLPYSELNKLLLEQESTWVDKNKNSVIYLAFARSFIEKHLQDKHTICESIVRLELSNYKFNTGHFPESLDGFTPFLGPLPLDPLVISKGYEYKKNGDTYSLKSDATILTYDLGYMR